MAKTPNVTKARRTSREIVDITVAPVPESRADEVIIEDLNDRLRQAEAVLSAMPWKSWSSIDAKPDVEVWFARSSNNWRLGCTTNRDDVPDDKCWDRCSLEEKALIAQALPALLSKMQEEAKERRAQVLAAHESLNQFEKLIRAIEEGK